MSNVSIPNTKYFTKFPYIEEVFFPIVTIYVKYFITLFAFEDLFKFSDTPKIGGVFYS